MPDVSISLRHILFAAAILAAGPSLAQGGNGECRPETPGAENGARSDDPSSTALLGRCGGIITPPAVGDGEIVEPAPTTGQMPVITPNDLPHGGNPSNNAP